MANLSKDTDSASEMLQRKKLEVVMDGIEKLFWTYIATGVAINVGALLSKVTDLKFLEELYIRLEPAQHVSSVGITIAAFFALDERMMKYYAQFHTDQTSRENYVRWREKWFPIIAIALIGIVNWFLESGVANPEPWGTPDTLDALYSILAILVVYSMWKRHSPSDVQAFLSSNDDEEDEE